ncbi:hypothetical protein CHS0354_001972 [Potamilus streckersoni]|uniref:Glycosyltransferase 2-like domain-containing protein n=1 Tax=Potamilus streckersoni TaxID=2493646 RepID=A0AAE0T6G3_9BIVA|nr:hypothetical protein CHS0354_001972 [Potamilus streckersoni]
MMRLSVLIITYNEARNIVRCLESVKDLADEIVVVDSFSTDNTEELSRRGGQFLSQALTNYCGQWIYHCGWYPDKKLRLWDKAQGCWQGDIHERVELYDKTAEAVTLRGNIHHYSYYTREEHYRKTEKYAQIMAEYKYRKNPDLAEAGTKIFVWVYLPSGAFGRERSAFAQLYRLENNTKFGMNVVLLSGPSIKVRQISTNSEASKSQDYNGGAVFYERIFRSQFGFSGAFGILRRDIDTRILSVNSSIEETAYQLQISGRSYFSRHKNRGFNFQIGADVNFLQIQSKFKVANSVILDKTSKTNVYTYGIFTGFDWIVKNTGVRANVGYMFGGQADNKEIENIHVTYTFNNPYIQVGTFAFF